MEILKKVTLEINKGVIYIEIKAKQNDTARYLLFTIVDNGVPFSLQRKEVKVFAVKPDGKLVYNACQITNSTNGETKLNLTSQMLAVPGTLKAELVISEGNNILSTIPFEIEVIKSLRDDRAVESTNEFGVLVEALSVAQEYSQKLQEGTENIELQYAKRLNELVDRLYENVDIMNNLDSKKMDKNTRDISVGQINFNLGKFDQRCFTDEFLQQMAGNAPINSVPADNSITSAKLTNKSVTNEKLAYVGIEKNRNVDYPLKFGVLGATIDNQSNLSILQEGLLDIKIFNAKRNTDYNLRYLTKNQGTFGDLILIDAVDRISKERRALFKTKKKIYNANKSGISTLILNAENGEEIVQLTFDYSVINDGFIPSVNNEQYPFRNNYISEDCLYYNDLKTYKNLISFNKEKEMLEVFSKYGKTKDLDMVFKRDGANKLFALYSLFSKDNSGLNTNYFEIGDKLAGTGSDWIGPYMVRAIENGDNGGRAYTGGSHSKANTMFGDPTAETVKYEIFLDGKLITDSGEYYGDNVDIYVKNRIMAYNTKTTNRYVLEEIIHYSIEGNKIDVDVNTKMLEDVVIEEYYGLQAICGIMNKVYYPLGKHATEQETNTSNDSGEQLDYFVDTFILKNSNGNDKWIIKMDNNTGLGAREYLPNNQPCAFTREYGKSYMKLIYNNNDVFKTGKRLFWKGSYEFYNE